MPENKLSVCVTTYNDEACITACLADLREVADELIVADAGSSDGTPVLAEAAGACVYKMEQPCSIGALKNLGMDRASGRWVLFLTADETLPPAEAEKLRALLKNPNAEGYLLRIPPESGRIASPAEALRLIRNRKGYRFQYQSFEVLPDEQIDNILNADIRLALRRDVPTRQTALRLKGLAQDTAAHPDDCYVNYLIGIKHLNEDDHAGSMPYFLKAYACVNTDYLFAAHLFKLFGRTLVQLGRYDEALAVLDSGIESFPRDTDLVVLRAGLYRRLGRFAQAIEDITLGMKIMNQTADISVPRPEIDAAGVWEELGDIYEGLFDAKRSLGCYCQAYQLNNANSELLTKICRLAEELDAVDVLTSLLKNLSRFPEQAVAVTETLIRMGESVSDRLEHSDPVYPRILMQKIEMSWYRNEPETAIDLLTELDRVDMAELPGQARALYRDMHEAFYGNAREYRALTRQEYKLAAVIHNNLMRQGCPDKAKALLPLLLNVQHPENHVGLTKWWAKENDLHTLRMILERTGDAGKAAECRYKTIERLLQYGYWETAETLLTPDDGPMEDAALVIWSTRFLKSLEGLTHRAPDTAEAAVMPGQGKPDEALLQLHRAVHYSFTEQSSTISAAGVHQALRMFYKKMERKAPMLTASLRVLQHDPLNETVQDEIYKMWREDGCYLEDILRYMVQPAGDSPFKTKEAFVSYIRGLISFKSEQYESADAFFSGAEPGEPQSFAATAYRIIILCLGNGSGEAEDLLAGCEDKVTVGLAVCKLGRLYVLRKLDEGLEKHPYSELLRQEKAAFQKAAGHCPG